MPWAHRDGSLPPRLPPLQPTVSPAVLPHSWAFSLGPLVNLGERAVHGLHARLSTRPRNGNRVVIDIEAEFVEPAEPEAQRLQQARARRQMGRGEPIAAHKVVDNRPMAPP